MRKGQTSTEFVLLMSFMMLVFTITFLAIQQRTLDMKESITQVQTSQLGNVIKNEAEMAQTSLDGYTKEFWIPDYINGEGYSIELIDNSEVIISFKEKNHIIFLNANISGSISNNKGYHIIRKNNGSITIGPGRIQ